MIHFQISYEPIGTLGCHSYLLCKIEPFHDAASRSTELHRFSDASEVGYGAVTYLCMVSTSQEVHCSFVLGRSRVAPIKLVTLPRLELAAAVVAVRLVKFILHGPKSKVDAVLYWCDSTAMLQYIANTSKRFRPFVGNRLKVIHDLSKVD